MSKKNLFFVILIFFVAASLARTQNAKAHSPSSMILSYSMSTDVLTVSFSHSVSDPNSHYVSTVRVQINGSTVLTETYTSQPTANGGSYQYNITAGTYDRIQVTLTCIQGGSITLCIFGGGGACTDDDGDQGIPGYFGLSVILAISVFVLLFVIHRKLRNSKTKNITM